MKSRNDVLKGLALLCILAAQVLLIKDAVLQAMVFLCLTLLFVGKLTRSATCVRSHIKITQVNDYLVAGFFYSMAFAVRAYHLEMYHNIDGLDARFGYVISQFFKGNSIFPCMAAYEFDESLSAFLFIPLIKVFGSSWLTYKLISVAFSVLAVPATFLYLSRIFSQMTGIAGASLLILSTYFQRNDALLSLVRFSLVGTCLICGLWLTSTRNLQRYPFRMALTGACLSAFSVYLHSTGRMVPLMIAVNMSVLAFKAKGQARMRMLKSMLVLMGINALILSPFLIYIYFNSGYLFFKKRQILGFHEDFPFSWQLLWDTTRMTIANFHYRAVLHTHFPDIGPLLPFETATASLYGIFILWKHRWSTPVVHLLSAAAITTGPLCFVTPGSWRGLYFGPAVVILTCIAAVAIGSLVSWMTSNRKMPAAILLVLLIGLISSHRVPGFFREPVAPPISNNFYTRLYEDLVREEKQIHFFDSDLGQMIPGNAVYEFICASHFDESYIFSRDPIRYFDDAEVEKALIIDQWSESRCVFILAPENDHLAGVIRKCFPDSRVDYLPLTGRLAVRLNSSESLHGIPDLGFTETEMVCDFMN